MKFHATAINDAATAATLACPTLLLESKADPLPAYEIAVLADTHRPFSDYDLGDIVGISIPGELTSSFRVLEITLAEDNDGVLRVTLGVNDLMTDYLHERTALLPRVDLSEPVTAIGTSTKDAILAGAAIGYRGMVKGILEALRKELDAPKIVATGGDAAWIVSGMQEVIAVDADLTLHGLRLVGNMA